MIESTALGSLCHTCKYYVKLQCRKHPTPIHSGEYAIGEMADGYYFDKQCCSKLMISENDDREVSILECPLYSKKSNSGGVK